MTYIVVIKEKKENNNFVLFILFIFMINRTYKDKLTEIIDEAKTQTQSPMLTQLKSLLNSTRIYCQTYKRMLLQIQA